ncbi:unnamed protein product [Tilletia controversa]|uniref:Uncharacterized protein n=3 Tax=Tilletia TaxID=13289 RepID=A0A8X7SVC9_9BASI|nr:hypothetical protein CF336_g5937 [Tilletia laevis]KAE8192006.1 hypothetical protein CF328_g5511 [Tilletia controversa]KAE8261395.1 hypothetical protein A4X03_0g3292 [Tilletia caries]KAE8195059.1 hypothetical protein CF335_g5188 [Tilletia laevis]KAE8243376.1 hypothetical protein A4X06_0g6359 [Tilletia controversa]
MLGTNAAASRRSNADPPVLVAKVEDVRSLASLIRPIAHAAHATISVEEAGLTFVTEYDRCVHARAWINAPLFSTFDVHLKPTKPAQPNPESKFTLDSFDDGNFTGLTSVADASSSSSSTPKAEFEINLHSFLEAIDIFGGASTIKANASGGTFSASSSTMPGGGGAGGQSRQQQSHHNQYRRADRPDAAGGKGAEGWKRRFGTGFGDAKRDGQGSASDHDGASTYGGPDWSHSGPTSMVMKYAGHGSPLILIMEENDVETQCSLATFEPSTHFEHTFDRDACVAQVIMKSHWLQEAIEVIDSSASKVTLHFLPTDRGGPTIGGPRPRRMQAKESLKLTADADFGAVEIDFPKESNMMDVFDCERATINSYRFSHLHQAIKALQVSLKVSMRTDERGLLSMQFLMPKGTGTGADPTMKKSVMSTPAGASMRGDGHGYIELLCVPLDEEAAEENESDEDDGYGGIGGAYSMHF